MDPLHSDPNGLACEALSSLHTGVVICEAHGAVISANGAAASLLDTEDLVGRSVDELLGPIESLERGLAAGQPEVVFERARGQMVLGYELASMAGGRWVLAFRNVTEQVRLRAERDRLRQLTTVDEVLPTVLHELRNPLAAITSAVEVLIDEHPPEDDPELGPTLSVILAELRRMGLVLQGIGAAGRCLRGDRPAALDQAAEEVVRIMAGRANQSGVTIARDIQALPPVPIDAVVFKAILFNLLNNALYACKPQGRIEVRLRLLPGPSLLLQVTDDGEGMPASVLAACTRPFFTTRANGSGLGLALCREAVEQAGGSLAIDSAPGRGTVVQISLPLASSRS